MLACPASAEAILNGESIKVGISATVTNATEAEVLPDMGPHKEITVTVGGAQIYIDTSYDFYNVIRTDEYIEIQF